LDVQQQEKRWNGGWDGDGEEEEEVKR